MIFAFEANCSFYSKLAHISCIKNSLNKSRLLQDVLIPATLAPISPRCQLSYPSFFCCLLFVKGLFWCFLYVRTMGPSHIAGSVNRREELFIQEKAHRNYYFNLFSEPSYLAELLVYIFFHSCAIPSICVLF